MVNLWIASGNRWQTEIDIQIETMYTNLNRANSAIRICNDDLDFYLSKIREFNLTFRNLKDSENVVIAISELRKMREYRSKLTKEYNEILKNLKAQQKQVEQIQKNIDKLYRKRKTLSTQFFEISPYEKKR